MEETNASNVTNIVVFALLVVLLVGLLVGILRRRGAVVKGENIVLLPTHPPCDVYMRSEITYFSYFMNIMN